MPVCSGFFNISTKIGGVIKMAGDIEISLDFELLKEKHKGHQKFWIEQE